MINSVTGAARRLRRLSIAFATVAASAISLLPPALAGTDGHSALKAVRSAGTSATSPGALADTGEWGELTVRNWRWFLSIPIGVSPGGDAGDANCGINQAGPVWFLGGPLTTTFTRTCAVPFGKAIFSPIIDYVNDFPCPDPAFKPAAGQSLQDFLTSGVTPLVDAVTVAEADLDGKPLAVQRVTSPLFPFVGAEDLSPAFDPCVTGAPQLGVSDGYFIRIPPLPRGTHVLHIHSESPFSGSSDGTYNLVIQ